VILIFLIPRATDIIAQQAEKKGCDALVFLSEMNGHPSIA
jgi:hypothetical protein